MNNKQYIEQLREELAEIEHNQWMDWSKNLATVEKLTPERLERWQKLWRPYSELTEEEKDQDRKYADIVLSKFLEREATLFRLIEEKKHELEFNLKQTAIQRDEKLVTIHKSQINAISDIQSLLITKEE